MKHLYRLWIWIPAIIILIVIFCLSSANGEQSSRLSLQLTQYIIKILKPISNNDFILLHTLVRKIGHMAEYALLAITIIIPLYFYHISSWRLALLCFSTCFIYACSDEFHQLFIIERSGQFTDVIIDSLGILAGITFFYIINYLYRFVRHYWFAD